MKDKIRKNSIYCLLRMYENEPEHAEQVRNLSLEIFDGIKGQVHNMGEYERDLLEAGALLHDIGYYISAKGHNKHAYYLIMSDPLDGYTDEEKSIISNIARYHRGKMPKSKHSNYNDLSVENKILVDKLAGIVRLADALDRSHLKVVKGVNCLFDSFTRILNLNLELGFPNCFQEINKCKKKKNLFENAFNLQIDFTANLVQQSK